MSILGASWKTSLGGVIALCAASGALGVALNYQFDGSATTVANWDGVVQAFGLVGAAFGLLNARDNLVSTPQAKAQP